MSVISAQVLSALQQEIVAFTGQDRWLKRSELAAVKETITRQFSALPLPLARLDEFDNCRDAWRQCQQWLEHGESAIRQRNREWSARVISDNHADFFSTVETSPLNPAQARAVVNGEQSLLVLAGAGSGKTSVLVARAGWLLTSGNWPQPEQILLLAFGRKAAQEMDERIQDAAAHPGYHGANLPCPRAAHHSAGQQKSAGHQ